MNYVRLGRTGLKVSEYCMGGDNFGGQADEAESLRVMSAAFDGGVNFIDTANVYEEGRSETFVGKFMQGRRYDVILATKGNGRLGLGPNDRQVSRKYAMQAIDDSLRRLQTDYIDLYQIHDFPIDVPIDEFVLAYSDIVQAGKARYIGVANFAAFQLIEAFMASGKTRGAAFRLLSRQIQLVGQRPRTRAISGLRRVWSGCDGVLAESRRSPSRTGSPLQVGAGQPVFASFQTLRVVPANLLVASQFRRCREDRSNRRQARRFYERFDIALGYQQPGNDRVHHGCSHRGARTVEFGGLARGCSARSDR